MKPDQRVTWHADPDCWGTVRYVGDVMAVVRWDTGNETWSPLPSLIPHPHYCEQCQCWYANSQWADHNPAGVNEG